MNVKFALYNNGPFAISNYCVNGHLLHHMAV